MCVCVTSFINNETNYCCYIIGHNLNISRLGSSFPTLAYQPYEPSKALHSEATQETSSVERIGLEPQEYALLLCYSESHLRSLHHLPVTLDSLHHYQASCSGDSRSESKSICDNRLSLTLAGTSSNDVIYQQVELRTIVLGLMVNVCVDRMENETSIGSVD